MAHSWTLLDFKSIIYKIFFLSHNEMVLFHGFNGFSSDFHRTMIFYHYIFILFERGYFVTNWHVPPMVAYQNQSPNSKIQFRNQSNTAISFSFRRIWFFDGRMKNRPIKQLGSPRQPLKNGSGLQCYWVPIHVLQTWMITVELGLRRRF